MKEEINSHGAENESSRTSEVAKVEEPWVGNFLEMSYSLIPLPAYVFMKAVDIKTSISLIIYIASECHVTKTKIQTIRLKAVKIYCNCFILLLLLPKIL